ncbi:hypothetical protein HY310_02415, partial [Candidatus Microgenomates bacterium]|nr:hypothetical protein [Candidatus Microgenomates bacterium]
MPKRNMNKDLPQPRETEVKPTESHIFSVIRPGGNDTALFRGVITDAGKRKKLNDSIMRVYPYVEQVGFVSLDTKQPELMMAGGE